ncbi:MAG: hypothetical protein IK032_01870, partial [Bacteroidales bacterium]|nr:hypothetical protein [Bacteroidales bacterium]
MRKYISKVLIVAAMLPFLAKAQCPAPSRVTVTNAAGSTALVSWTSPGVTASSYDVEFKTSAGATWT